MVQLYKSLGGGWLPEERPDAPPVSRPVTGEPVSRP
jgi:hypothetical protein